MTLSTIKIPEKVYIGFQGRRTQDEVPLGFMTPFTTDAAGLKRRSSVDSWAAGHGRDKTFNSVTLDNKPMIGFKVGRSIRRSGGWNGSGASYIRIEDPRGFELEITIENLAMCMNGNIIEDGEIIQECVWGRDGGRNILLPINSEPFKDSVTTSSKIDNAVSLRLVKPGDHIKLISGEEGIYMGSMYSINVEHYGPTPDVDLGKKKYVIKHTDKSGKVTYKGWSTIKVDRILEACSTKMTSIEIDTELNNAMTANNCVFDDTSVGWRSHTRGFMVGDSHTIISRFQIDYTEAQIKEKLGFFENVTIIAENDKMQYLVPHWKENFITDRNTPGRKYTVYSGGSGYYRYNSTRTDIITNGLIGIKAHIVDNTITKLTSDNDREIHFENSDVLRLFATQVEIKSKSGVIFTCML